MNYCSFKIDNLPCVKRIVFLIHPFPLSWIQVHLFSFRMILIPGDEWLALIWCQMKNEIMIVSCSITKLDWFPIIADLFWWYRNSRLILTYDILLNLCLFLFLWNRKVFFLFRNYRYCKHHNYIRNPVNRFFPVDTHWFCLSEKLFNFRSMSP